MLSAKQINFSYPNLHVVKNVNFDIAQGENVSIIGESGCGKSTLLKLIFGIYDLDSGELLFNQQRVKGPKSALLPETKFVKYLAQDFGLMPYITVAENVGKYLSNQDKTLKSDRIRGLLNLVDMTEYADQKAQFLSGGQQQRIALAMVLAAEPKLLLLDEPFSQIDVFRTNSLRRRIFSYLKSKAITCIVATHDRNDALGFADRILVMKDGEIVQNDTPTEVFNNPASSYVASLFGDVNLIRGSYFNRIEDMLLVYPHQLKVAASGLKVKIVANYFQGDGYLVEASYGNQIVYFKSKIKMPPESMAFLSLQF